MSDRQQQLEILGRELEVHKTTIDEITVQKTKAETNAQQYRVDLENAVKAKAALEQELSQAQLLIQQAEVKRTSLEDGLQALKKNIEESTNVRRSLEEHLKRRDSDVQDLERELKTREGAEAELLSHVRSMELDFTKSAAKGQKSESQVTVTKMQSSSMLSSSLQKIQAEAEVLQQKVEELTVGKKKAESEIKTVKSELNGMLMQKNMSEEKAQRFKELLDDSNNRLMRLQMDMDADKNSVKQKLDEMRQETSELKKSVYVYQEQVKSLQRDKSSMEQRAIFHKTEVEGIKEQLKISQEKLLQKNSVEQDVMHKMRCLEDELATTQLEGNQLKYKLNETTRVNGSLENDVRNLKVCIESLQKDKSFAEQKIKTLKAETEMLMEHLRNAKEDLSLKVKAEKDSHLKHRSLEMELQKSGQEVTQLTKKVEELKKINMEMEHSLKSVQVEMDKVNIELGSKDQQISIFKTQAESTKCQVKIIEEELLKVTNTAHEFQVKLRGYNQEIMKTAELEQKNKILAANIATHEKEIKTLKSELNSVSNERNTVKQKVQDQKQEINELNISLKKSMGDLQRENGEVQKYSAKVKDLENELLNCKQAMKGITGNSEKITVNLRQDLLSVQREKQMADQNLLTLKRQFDDLSATLRKSKDELIKVTQEANSHSSKVKNLEEELQKSRGLIKDISSTRDKDMAAFKQEIAVLQKEKSTAYDKVQQLTSEMASLQRDRNMVLEKNQHLGKEISQVKMQLAQVQGDLRKSQIQTSNAQTLELSQVKQEIVVLQKENSLAHAKIQQMTSEMAALEVDKNTLLEKNKNLSKEISQVKIQLEQAQGDIKKSQIQASNAQTLELSQVKQDILVLQKERTSALEKLQQMTSEMAALKVDRNLLLEKNQQLSLEVSQVKMKLEHAQENIEKSQKETSIDQTLSLEISQLKMQLQRAQDNVTTKQKEVSDAQVKSKLLQDQLENCKCMLDELKDKLEKQKSGYEKQLQLVQTEMEQKLIVRESRMKIEFEKKSMEHSQNTEAVERDHKHLLQEIEKLRVLYHNSQISKQETQQQLDSLRVELQQAEKNRGAMELELLKAKSKISDLENEKIKLTSSFSQLDSLRKENSKEVPRLKQTLGEAERKLQVSEKEVKSLKEKVVTYMEEVKNLQEKVLQLEVKISSESKRVKELESDKTFISCHQCPKDHEIAKLKTELKLTENIVSSYEEAKRSLEDELKKMEVSSQVQMNTYFRKY